MARTEMILQMGSVYVMGSSLRMVVRAGPEHMKGRAARLYWTDVPNAELLHIHHRLEQYLRNNGILTVPAPVPAMAVWDGADCFVYLTPPSAPLSYECVQ